MEEAEFAIDPDLHVCVSCGHCILAKETHYKLSNGRIHEDCLDKHWRN